MKIEVKSRREAIDLSNKRNSDRIAVISISDTDKKSPTFKKCAENGIEDILYMRFDDLDKEPESALSNQRCMDIDDAVEIVEFLHEIRGRTDTLVVHCEFGMSRSAGVAAAIMKALTGTNSQVMRNKRYLPNPLCYRLVLKEYKRYPKIKKIKQRITKAVDGLKTFLNSKVRKRA